MTHCLLVTQVPAAFALAVSSNLIACACTAGVVRLFATRTLAFKGNLPRPSTGRSTGGGTQADAGRADGGSSGGGGMVSAPGGTGPDPLTSAGALFPDAVGCAFNSTGDHLTVVYADRSLMIWDVRNPARVGRQSLGRESTLGCGKLCKNAREDRPGPTGEIHHIQSRWKQFLCYLQQH